MLIPPKLRERLEEFICGHENCTDKKCLLKTAESWVREMESRGYPRREMVLLNLAYQVYLSKEIMRRDTATVAKSSRRPPKQSARRPRKPPQKLGWIH